jgi:hypothetical protein
MLKRLKKWLVGDSPKNISEDIQLTKLEDDGSLYILTLDKDHKTVKEISSLISENWHGYWQMDKSDICILKGKLGGDLEFHTTTLEDISPFICSKCDDEKLYDEYEKEFYCPVCSGN